MTLVTATDVGISFGERTLFSGISFIINRGDKIGLVGHNGCGKTTLFKTIVGELTPSEGTVSKKKLLKLGYLEQHACADSERSAQAETEAACVDIQKIENELAAVELKLTLEQTPELISLQESLNEQYIALGGLTYKSRARSALLGLGLTENELTLPVSSLSGGQRAKIGLAGLLLSEPELLLLDEPTNHLDIEAIEWLEEYLIGFTGAVLIISHDRYFLDRITSKTLEIKHGKMFSSNGNYSRHLQLEAERQLTIEREYDKAMEEIRRIEGIIAQQKTFSMERNYRTIDHKQKSIDRIREALVVPDREERAVHFKFNTNTRTGNDVLKAEGLQKIYDGRTLFENVSLDIKRQEHVFLLGPNGTGKTTLLREILQNEGVKFGSQVTVGYFDQLQSGLDYDKTVLEEIWSSYSHLTETTVRSALAAFLFKGDDVYKKIESLSGGERARISLCRLMLSGDNLLLLDEPTNHLDLRSREALETALESFDGTLIAVSHDRYFINKLSTRILYLDNASLTSYTGNYDDFTAQREVQAVGEIPAEKKQMGSGGVEYHRKKEQRKEISRLKTAAKKSEERIGEIETEISEIEGRLSLESNASDYKKTMELTESLEKLNAELSQKMDEWEKALEALEEMEETA